MKLKVLSMKLIGHGEDKMRRQFLFSMFFFLCCHLYGIDWLEELSSNFILESSCFMGIKEYGNRFRRDGEELFVEYGIYNKEPMKQAGVIVSATEKYPLKEMRLNESTGFLEIQIKDSQSPFQIIILGDYHVLGIPKENYSWKNKKSADFFQGLWPLNLEELPPSLHKYDLRFIPVDSFPFCDVILDVKSSSYLTEYSGINKIEYSGDNLDKYIVTSKQVYSNGHSINQYCFPWVENVDGVGNGEWIECSFNSPQTVMYLLNGFVDPSRPHLFKENSRMKVATIEGRTSSGEIFQQTVFFEDFVYFKTVVFSNPVIKIRITIEETYSGSKWQDTALSAILFRQ